MESVLAQELTNGNWASTIAKEIDKETLAPLINDVIRDFLFVSIIGKSSLDFRAGIYRVLKRVHPDIGITKQAMNLISAYVCHLLEKIAVEAGNLSRYTKSNTIGEKEIQTAVKIVICGKYTEKCVKKGQKAVIKYAK